MDLSPRNQFNCRLSGRYWDIPTNIPMATPLNSPVSTYECNFSGFMCHPQKYPNIHGGDYRDIETESKLNNLDYYNPYDVYCDREQKLSPQLVNQHFCNVQRVCPIGGSRLWNNHTKMHKYNQYV